MSYNINDIIQYRIEKSERTFLEAKSLKSSQFWNGAVNRLYYTCYHIVSALLIKDGINASTHNGVRSQFFKFYIKTEKMDRRFSVLYSDLMNKRQESDYDDFHEFKQEDVNPLFEEVEEFINVIKKEINKAYL
jgi:uncharacterized protein (UPF0332 family)